MSNAIQIFVILVGSCGLVCATIYNNFKWMMADFEAGMRHAMQCAFCDLSGGRDVNDNLS